MSNFISRALTATDNFYSEDHGFKYNVKKSVSWLKENIEILPKKGRILDLCCGDGFWSYCFHQTNKKLEYHGIDISSGAIKKAQKYLPKSATNFVVGDVENEFIWPKAYFDYIFARGPGVYNQHSMKHNGAVECIEMWHSYLKENGVFCSIFASTPHLIGTYTPIEKVVLPYNKEARETKATKFSGGKYHHSIETFLEPFWAAKNLKIISYKFVRNNHVLLTKKIAG